MGILNIFKNIFKKDKFIPGVISRDPYDPRDFILSSVQPEIVSLPEEFDLRDKMTSVEHQNWGTCTCAAVDGIKEFLDSQEYHKEIKLSQKFIYVNMKKISGLYNTEGDYIRNALKSVCDYGACLEISFPDIKRSSWNEYVHDEPPSEAYQEAEKYKGKTYWSVGKTLDEFRQAIYQQKAPIEFGMMWYKSYNKPNFDGRLPLPDTAVGGHAMVAVGWTKNKLWIRNSWSKSWGLNGYFYIPFNEFNKHDIWDAWILTDIEKPEEIIGWCAENYLKEISTRFQKGEIISPVCNLKLREKPTTNSKQITILKPGQKLEVIEGNIQGGSYRWWRIKVLND